MANQRKTYTHTFKQDAVKRLHEGAETATEIERDLEISRGLLSRWKRELASDSVQKEPLLSVTEVVEDGDGDANEGVDSAENLPEPTIDLTDASLYVNRELSQIEFNRRVLGESFNTTHPLLERAKFVAIFASNMDEFFMVRVSGLKQQVALGITETAPDGLTPREQLIEIHARVTKLLATELESYQRIHRELLREGIQIRGYEELKPSRKKKLRQYFDHEIFPALTPLAFDPSHPFPHISNLSLNLAVVIRDPDTHTTRFARVKVPPSLPRIVPLRRVAPDGLRIPSTLKYVWIEEIIMANLDRLFPGMEIVDAHPFRVTRNNDMEIQEEEADDLLLSIEDNLRMRHFGKVVRLEIDSSMPKQTRDVLMQNFDLASTDVYISDGPLALSSLWDLQGIERPELKDDHFFAKQPVPLRGADSIFSVLQRQDVLMQRPYDSFSEINKFIEAAATDPDVVAIKITLYRVGRNPNLINALVRARENGKQVAAIVELKARFDEESNISWARALERAGVHVVYGVIGLKVHAKMMLVVRRERDGLRRYLHLSTGNYNASTARVYEDLDLLTGDEIMCADASEVFNYLTGFSKQRNYHKLLVAPLTLRPRLLEMIEVESSFGKEGHIIFKANSLVHPAIIQALYRANQAGVRIDLIIRGICCLTPGIEGVSENIRVISIVGRFLEHSRIYYFRNGGTPMVYCGSADLMQRNLDRRVEVVFPINDPILRKEIVHNLLGIQLSDTAQAHEMQPDGRYKKIEITHPEESANFSSQNWFLYKRKSLQQPFSPDAALPSD